MNFMKKQKKLLSLKEERILDFLKIVSDDERFKIIYLLRQKPYCVCELSQLLYLPQNLVSYHLKVLKNYDFLSSEKEGVKIFYSLNRGVLNRHLKLFNKIFN